MSRPFPSRSYDAWRTESDIDRAERLNRAYAGNDDRDESDEEWERKLEELREQGRELKAEWRREREAAKNESK